MTFIECSEETGLRFKEEDRYSYRGLLDRETGRLNLGVRSMGDGEHFTSIDPLWEKTPWMSPYAYGNDNPLRMTDPTGLQALNRVPYVASVEWLEYGAGGGGGGGIAPLVVIGGAITYATEHPEKTGPFIAKMANDISQALTNPMGFATNNITELIAVASSKPKDWAYYPAPKAPPFDGLKKATKKTPRAGGGGLRERWVDSEGNIYEWDYQHGTVEKYNKRGKHLGELDPETGKETKPADPSRKVEP